jgi:hypothetical protein
VSATWKLWPEAREVGNVYPVADTVQDVSEVVVPPEVTVEEVLFANTVILVRIIR